MSKFFCPLPWIHQFIQADGIKMCCSSFTKLDVSPVDFHKSIHIANIKNVISKGEVPEECYRGCLKLEEQGYTSTRLLALKDWNYTIETVPDKILYLDLRHSNLCNFSCRSCEPSFSSEIAREMQKNLKLSKYHTPTDIHLENHKSQQDIKDLLPSLQRINFTGGEPLLIKENINILEELMRVGNTDCEILITTNASVINDKIVDLIGHFNRVHWTISIDAVGTAAEYIRNGTVWPTIEKNIMQILQTKQSVAFNTVISAYSMLDLGNLLEYFKDLKSIYNNQPLELWFSICELPNFLSPMSANDQMKTQALSELSKSIDILAGLDNPIRSIQTLESLQKNLKESIINKTTYDKFVNYTRDLDQIRNQNFNQTFGIDYE
jgi:sulfatase maturation enzyme AslB (radical SAM superfamily)